MAAPGKQNVFDAVLEFLVGMPMPRALLWKQDGFRRPTNPTELGVIRGSSTLANRRLDEEPRVTDLGRTSELGEFGDLSLPSYGYGYGYGREIPVLPLVKLARAREHQAALYSQVATLEGGPTGRRHSCAGPRRQLRGYRSASGQAATTGAAMVSRVRRRRPQLSQRP